MAENEKPHFTSGVTERDLYGERQSEGMALDMSLSGGRGGGGGFPWFRNRPSPYGNLFDPNAASPVPETNPNPVEPWKESEWQGPDRPGGGGGGLGGLFSGMSKRDILALVTGLTSLVGGAMSGRPNNALNSGTNDPQMRELTDLMMGRIRKSEPMFESVQAMANGLLPTAYQRGNFTPYTPGGGTSPLTPLTPRDEEGGGGMP